MVARCLAKVVSAPFPEDMGREVIVVDDCSTDGTGAILESIAAEYDCIRLVRHTENRGKGAAVRTAIQHATGDFCIVQDADLEYDPDEYSRAAAAAARRECRCRLWLALYGQLADARAAVLALHDQQEC